MAFGKAFESLYTGSMVGSGLAVFAVWNYCIANAKPPGSIELNPVIMAAIFGCKVPEVEEAIETLCQPDPKSRTKDQDGKRLINAGSFLYTMPTWPKYNELRNDAERRAQNAKHQKAWRERQRDASSEGMTGDDVSDDDLTGKSASAESAHGDADSEMETQTPESHHITSHEVSSCQSQKGEGIPASELPPADPGEPVDRSGEIGSMLEHLSEGA